MKKTPGKTKKTKKKLKRNKCKQDQKTKIKLKKQRTQNENHTKNNKNNKKAQTNGKISLCCCLCVVGWCSCCFLGVFCFSFFRISLFCFQLFNVPFLCYCCLFVVSIFAVVLYMFAWVDLGSIDGAKHHTLGDWVQGGWRAGERELFYIDTHAFMYMHYVISFLIFILPYKFAACT